MPHASGGGGGGLNNMRPLSWGGAQKEKILIFIYYVTLPWSHYKTVELVEI